MSQENQQKPYWVNYTLNDVQRAKQDWRAIHQAGQADVRRGLETVKIANLRLQQLDYLEQTLRQSLPPDMWHDEIVAVTGTYLGGTVSAFQRDSNHLAGLYAGLDQYKQGQHEYLINAVNNTGVSSGSMVYMGAEIERRFVAIAPTYKPILKTAHPSQLGSRQETFDDLAGVLRQFDPRYLQMLTGSEEALHTHGADHLSQAAHSMRDLFQQLIEHLAPADTVKQQPWFAATPGAPGGVSRMSRLRYVLYGSGESLDEREIEQLDDAAERAKTALDLAIARAHDHDPQLTDAEVEMAIDHARFSLFEVLKRYTTRRNWGAAYT